MNIINCTPHPVTIGGLAIAPSGMIPRVTEITTPDSTVHMDGQEIPILTITYGDVYDLPDPEDGTLYVVARMVSEAMPHRKDLVFPTQQIRDGNGRIVGCRALGKSR